MLAWIGDNTLLILLALGTAFSFYWLMRCRQILEISWWVAAVLSVMHTLVGVLSVKVFAVLETLDLSSAGNMSLFGGVFFMPLAYWLGAKVFGRKMALVCDVFTPCMVFTVMCARINCVFAGCCLGAYIPGTTSGLRFPTRELEIVFYILLLVYLWHRDRQGKTMPGERYPLYMVAYGICRFVLEGFRNSDSESIFHISHLWALISFAVGLAVYLELINQKIKPANKHGKVK